MKRLIAAAIIFIGVLATSISGIWIIRATGGEVEKKITDIQSTYTSQNQHKAEDFFYYWEKKKELMSVFVNHEDLNEIGTLAARMVSAERSGDSQVLFESANEILFIMRSIEEDEKFSLFTFL